MDRHRDSADTLYDATSRYRCSAGTYDGSGRKLGDDRMKPADVELANACFGSNVMDCLGEPVDVLGGWDGLEDEAQQSWAG